MNRIANNALLKYRSGNIRARLLLCLILSALFLSGSFMQAAPGKKKQTGKLTEEESWLVLQEHVDKESGRLFKNLTRGYPFRVLKMPAEDKMLKRIANRMSRAMGQGEYTKPIVIAQMGMNRGMVNAMTFPGGQMVFLVGLFDVLKKRAGEMAKAPGKINTKLGPDKARDYHYERLVAGVVGHEMGHYMGRHFMRRYSLMVKSFNARRPELKLEQIKYGQSQELEADNFGLQALIRSGYEEHYAVEVLKILNGVHKRQQGRMNPYLTSHPSPNVRLATLAKNSKDKEYYGRLAKLEAAFASIETGANLKEASETLEAELKRSPKNTYLLSAAARVFHRRWEASCSLDELLFKTSIAPLYFQDEMVGARSFWSATRGEKRKLPGDAVMYEKSRFYYKKAMRRQADYVVLSSYAALLIYKPGQEQAARVYAEHAARKVSSLAGVQHHYVLNNLGVVLYFLGDKANAEASFKKSAGGITRMIKVFKQNKLSSHDNPLMQRRRLIMGFSSRNTGGMFEPMFNLGQLYYRTGNQKQARQVWEEYLTHLDWTSEWAKHIAAKLTIDLDTIKPERPPRVAGVGPGSSVPALVRAWGKPDKETPVPNHRTRWEYRSRGVIIMMELGIIKSLRITEKGSPPLSNGVKVGMKRGQVEKVLGKPGVANGKRVLYPRKYLALSYDNSRVSEIVIRK